MRRNLNHPLYCSTVINMKWAFHGGRAALTILIINVCLSRLRLLHRRLLNSPELLKEYDRTIREKLSKGIVESAPRDCLQGRVHYLPHHGIICIDRHMVKLQIFYDWSMRLSSNAVSLNNCLETGPNLTPKLFNVLIKFRWHMVTVITDIEKAFLMIGILPDDRDMLQFLWLEDPFDTELYFTIKIHLLGVWSTPFSSHLGNIYIPPFGQVPVKPARVDSVHQRFLLRR